MKNTLLFIALFMLSVSYCLAASKSISLQKTSQTPVIDGVLDEACWNDAQAVSDFVLLGDDKLAKEQTIVRVTYDDTNLYVGVISKESQMDKLSALHTAYGPEVCSDDCVEIFLDPNHDKFNYFHFVVNAIGVQFDASGDGVGVAADWNAVWESKTTQAADSWTAEVAIPLSVLSISSKVGETWGFNVCRSEKPSGELSCWSQTGSKFAVPSSFGEITGLKINFNPYLLTIGVTNWGAAMFGGNTAEIKVTNDGPVERDLNLRLTITPPQADKVVYESRLGKIAPGTTKTATMPYQMSAAGEHKLIIEALDASADNKTCATTGRRFSVSPLAEFSIFKSYYRDDVAVRYQVNVQQAELKKFRLLGTITPDAVDVKPVQTKHLSKIMNNGELRFDTSKLALGDYKLHIDLLDSTGKSAISEDLSFTILRQPDVKPIYDIDVDNFIRFNGKRIFPVGIYISPSNVKGMRDLAEAGYSVIMAGVLPPEAMKAFLDKAQEHHLKVWVPVSSLLDFSKEAEAKKKTLTDLVAAVGDHPALLMWESIDEPAWGSQNADGLYEGYKFLRALDPKRPIWTNHAPRNLISTLAYFNRATDIAGCDIYPVPEPQSQSNLPNRTIHVVGDEADKSVASVNGDKPIIMVLQGFGWAELGGLRGASASAILPTFAQSRFMAYDAILHGAKGINYWGTAFTEKPSSFYSELKTLVSELTDMEPVLTSEIITGEKAGTVVSDDNAVQMMRRKLNGKTYIIAINTLNQRRRADFSLPGLSSEKLRVLYEDRTVTFRNGILRDNFRPYGVHIYTDDPDFNPVWKDFSDEYKNVQPQLLPLREPGNLVANPSFEYDPDGDLTPEGWNAGHPFTVEISTEEFHSGKQSLMITSTGEDFAPLAVAHGLPGLKPEGNYVLSAWVKTDRPGLTFRIYTEWAGWHSAILPWTPGTGEWQYVEIPYASEPAAVGTSYAVVQIKGIGKAWFDEVTIKER